MLSTLRFMVLIATSFVCMMKHAHFNLIVTKPEPPPILRDPF